LSYLWKRNVSGEIMIKICLFCDKFISCKKSVQEWKKIKEIYPKKDEFEDRLRHMEKLFRECKEKTPFKESET
jgi:hypothetical protein